MKQFITILFFLAALSAQAQNVGIGTTTPNQKLDVNKGRMRFTGNPGPGVSQGIEFTDPAGTTLNGFVGVYNDSITGMYGFLGSNWSFLHNNKNGNIGLQGNTNPRAPLSFAGTTGNKIALWGNADGAHYGVGIQGNQMQLYADAVNSDITFGYGKSTSFTENMRIKGNGNVGIGTATPAAKLDVNGRLQTSAGASLGGDVDILGDLQTQGAIATDASLFVSDNATINGTVKIAGGSPGAGKVLTSDANGNASWQKSAYANTERFQYKVIAFNDNSGTMQSTFSTLYNYGTATESHNNTDIIVEFPVAGLYHFDVNFFINDSYNSNPFKLHVIKGSTGFNYVSQSIGKIDDTLSESGSIDKSLDLYIETGGFIRFSTTGGSLIGMAEKRTLIVTGHKIAD